MIFCTACGTESDDQALFCDQCGEQLTASLLRVCQECGHRNRSQATFCSACGTGLELPATAAAVAAEPPVAAAPPPQPSVATEPICPPAPRAEPTVARPEVPERPREPEAASPNVRQPAASSPHPSATVASDVAVRSVSPPSTVGGRGSAARRPREEAIGTRRPPPPPPAGQFVDNAREWAASRQADILLYLGAFLLVAAALLFVSSQGDGVSSGLRVALLLVYTVGFLAAGIAAQRAERIREAGAVFLAIGALITPLNFLLIYTEILEARDISRAVVWLIGSMYSALFYALLWQRGYGRLYAVPAGIAVVSAWAALAAVVGLPNEWLGTWWIFFFVAASAVADRVRAYVLPVAISLGVLLGLALFVQVVASNLLLGENGEFPLAVSLALLTAWFALTGWLLRAPLLLPFGATSAIAAGIASIRAADLEADWAAYAPLTVGFLAVYTRRWWSRWHLGVARFGWLYAAACGAAPAALIPAYDVGINGAVSFLLGAAVLASVAWRDSVDRSRFFDGARPGAPPPLVERTFFAWLGFALFLVGVGYAQRELAIEDPNTGWSFVAISLVSIAILARTGRAWTPALAVLIPPALLAIAVSLPEVRAYSGHVALYLGIPALAFLGSFAVSRRWPITLVASAAGALAAAAAWDTLGLTEWSLATAYSAVGVGLFALLATRRRYRPESTSIIQVILSWGFVILGPAVSYNALLPVDDFGARAVVESAEYRTTLYLLLVGAALLLTEGWRTHNWNVTAAATTLAALVVAPLWNSYGWPAWTLAFTYLGVGVVRFATMNAVRTYRDEIGQFPIVVLSWGLVAAAPFTAWLALSDRMANEGGVAVEMVEYRAFIAGVFAFAPLLLFEARRLRARWALVSSSVVAMTALLLTIAAFRVDDVQAYTVPVGLYLIAFGLVVRRSVHVVERHMMLHELVLLVGVAIILGPQVREGLQPDGAEWGGVILLEGLALLLVGFLLASRWLTVSGVVAISAVAIRWLAVNSGDAIPYWVTLGGVGMLLLALGTVMLLARDRWSAFKHATTSWWGTSATLRGVGIESPVVFAPAAVGLIAIVVAAIEDWVEPSFL